MTTVKICGVTNQQDALMAIEAGANMLGINMIPTARRYAGPELGWLNDLMPLVSLVAVIDDLAALDPKHFSYFDAVQYYTDTREGNDLPSHRKLIPVVRLKGEESLAEVAAVSPDAAALVLDAYHPNALGGTGLVCDWELAARAVACSPVPVMLAGGLTAENVADAIVRVRPYGVDVSSGVEAEVGKKDPAKVRMFISAAQAAANRL
ncbi:MAG: phosphoribosylanthranilate isomerase [Armatimonas sp.]